MRELFNWIIEGAKDLDGFERILVLVLGVICAVAFVGLGGLVTLILSFILVLNGR